LIEPTSVKLVVSTVGPGVVKSSYRSGKPAIGVGSGNVPVLVDEKANFGSGMWQSHSRQDIDNGVI
jgi:acetaldehyde dehydrogenase/alcohol dehydrogenase